MEKMGHDGVSPESGEEPAIIIGVTPDTTKFLLPPPYPLVITFGLSVVFFALCATSSSRMQIYLN
jgi:hypothetical protein